MLDFLNQYHLTGIAVGAATFLIIGLFHPLVIKAEYHLGVRSWWIFLIAGILFIIASLLVKEMVYSILLAVIGFSSFRSILEVCEQRKSVYKGWFPSKQDKK